MIGSLRLDTSDFTVQRRLNDRISVWIDSAEHSVELDLDPGVVIDLVIELANPEAGDDV